MKSIFNFLLLTIITLNSLSSNAVFALSNEDQKVVSGLIRAKEAELMDRIYLYNTVVSLYKNFTQIEMDDDQEMVELKRIAKEQLTLASAKHDHLARHITLAVGGFVGGMGSLIALAPKADLNVVIDIKKLKVLAYKDAVVQESAELLKRNKKIKTIAVTTLTISAVTFLYGLINGAQEGANRDFCEKMKRIISLNPTLHLEDEITHLSLEIKALKNVLE